MVYENMTYQSSRDFSTCASCEKLIKDTTWMGIAGKHYHDKCVTEGIIEMGRQAEMKQSYLNQRPYNCY